MLAGVCHGFIGNRMLRQRQIAGQPADPGRRDALGRSTGCCYDFGLPMGPFQMSDLAGLDIGWTAADLEGRDRPRRCCASWTGAARRPARASTTTTRTATPRRRRSSPKIIEDFAAKTGIAPRTVSDEEILERCLYPMINEGAKILDEGMAIRASDIDIVWINGYGWPVYRGGPMFWADLIGLDKVLAALRGYEAKFGDAFKPSPLLVRLVDEGKGFKDL